MFSESLYAIEYSKPAPGKIPLGAWQQIMIFLLPRYNVISQRGGRQLRKGKKGLADMGASRVHYPSNLRPSRQTLHKVPGKLQMLQ